MFEKLIGYLMSHLFEYHALIGLTFSGEFDPALRTPPSFVVADRVPNPGFSVDGGQPAKALYPWGFAQGQTNYCPSDIGAISPECLVLIGKK